MRKLKEYAGLTFGDLCVIKESHRAGGHRFWIVRCSCGATLTVKSGDFGPQRKRQSCGCKVKSIGERSRLHGMSKHPAHGVWMSMINRCYRKTDRGWKNYGGRGIGVCNSWRKSFLLFWKDMAATYQHGLTLERKNNARGYYRANCFWATRIQQGRNKRNNRFIKTPWGRLCLAEAAEKSGINLGTLSRRVKNKWPYKELFSAPYSQQRVSR